MNTISVFRKLRKRKLEVVMPGSGSVLKNELEEEADLAAGHVKWSWKRKHYKICCFHIPGSRFDPRKVVILHVSVLSLKNVKN